MLKRSFLKRKTMNLIVKVMFLSVALFSFSANAATTEKDLQVVARAAAFTEGLAKGDIQAAIVYDAGSAASKADADGIAAIMGGGLSASGVTLKPMLVSSGSLGSLGGAGVVIIADGSGAVQGAAFSAAGGKLTVSTDFSCVQSGKCVMGVRSEPKVEIVVNRNAAASAGVSFAQAFRMMISEI